MVSIDEFLTRSGGKAKVYKNFRLTAEQELTEKLAVAVPDMHLLEKGLNDDFLDAQRAKQSLGERSAHEKRFMDFLDFLTELKTELKEDLEIVQLGDMYDLWQARGNTNKIESKYTNVLGLMEKLQTVYVIGNHDFDLWNYYKKKGATFKRKWRHYAKNKAGEVAVFYEHGFQADFANNQDRWTGVIGREITKVISAMEYIEPDIDLMLGNIWDSISRTFTIYNAGLTPVKDPTGFNTHEYINHYVNVIEKYRNGQTDDHQQLSNLVCAVIGHTHQARLVTRPYNGVTHYLMDCGSWVNGGHEFGIITGNEMAVCQWG